MYKAIIGRPFRIKSISSAFAGLVEHSCKCAHSGLNGISGELGIKPLSACRNLVVYNLCSRLRPLIVTTLLDLMENIEKWELWEINRVLIINHNNI